MIKLPFGFLSLATILTLSNWSNLIAPSLAEELDRNLPPTNTPTSIVAQISLDRTSEVEINQIENRLAGQWQLQRVFLVSSMTIVLRTQGRGFVLVPVITPNGQLNPVAYEFSYRINNTNQPWAIDLELPEEEPIRTIFDFTNDGRIRVELLGTRPGEPRPTEFTTGALFLNRVSNLTDLPRNTEIANSLEARNRSKERLTAYRMETLLGSQELYFQENKRFTLDLKELGLELSAQYLRYYDYVTYLPENPEQPLVITATAKIPGLKSFLGVIFPIKENDKVTTISKVCGTDTPSMTPPGRPTFENRSIICAPGSREYP